MKQRIGKIVLVGLLLIVVLGGMSGVFRGSTTVQNPAPNAEQAAASLPVTATVLQAARMLVPQGYDATSSVTQSVALDSARQAVLVCALPQNSQPATEAYFGLFTPTATGFTQLASYTYRASGIQNMPCTGRNQTQLDLDGDGLNELVLSLGTGGASTDSYGIFKINLASKTLIHTTMKDPDGTISPTEFLSGSSVTHTDGFEFRQLGSDPQPHLVLENALLNIDADPTKVKNWLWDMEAYDWNGSMFAYDKALTDAHPELMSEFQAAQIKAE